MYRRPDFLNEMAYLANLQSLSDHDSSEMTALDQAMLRQLEDEEARFMNTMSRHITPRTTTRIAGNWPCVQENQNEK